MLFFEFWWDQIKFAGILSLFPISAFFLNLAICIYQLAKGRRVDFSPAIVLSFVCIILAGAFCSILSLSFYFETIGSIEYSSYDAKISDIYHAISMSFGGALLSFLLAVLLAPIDAYVLMKNRKKTTD